MTEHENVKAEFIQKYVFLYKNSYTSVCSKIFLMSAFHINC